MTKFAIASEHRDFFNKQHSIELEELLNAKQLQRLTSAIDTALALRLKLRVSELPKAPETLFMAGRDLWRGSDVIKNIVTQRQFSQIAAELTGQRMLRLGYDQFFSEPLRSSILTQAMSKTLFPHPQTLTEISSLQGVQCGLMLCLRGEASEEEEASSPLFSKQAGSGVFFNPQTPFLFQPNAENTNSLRQYLMIVYVSNSSVYLCNHSDPQVHALKQYGYVFGDKLNDKRNPIVYR